MSLRSFLRCFAILCLLTVLAGAQTALDGFHQAVDSFEYEKAARLAEKLPAGPARELCLAEVDVLRERADLSFAHTDKVDTKTLPPDLLAKLYLVKAYQETATFYPLRDDRERAVTRMIRDGLRGAGSPHDRAQLLLLKIEQSTADQSALASEAAEELAELEGADARLALRGQAMAAGLAGRQREAATLWKSLAETSGLKGQRRAETLFTLKVLEGQNDAEHRAQSAAACQALLQQSAQAKDPLAVLACWRALRRLLPEMGDTPRLTTLATETLAKLDDSVEKLAVLDRVLSLYPESEGFTLAEKAAERAKALHEPAVEGYLLYQASRLSPLRARGSALRQQAISQLTGSDLRGVSGTWFGPIRWLVEDQPTAATSHERTLAKLSEAMAAIDPAKGPQQRITVYSEYLSSAISRPLPELAEATLLPGLELAASLPEPDRQAGFSNFMWALNSGNSWRSLAQRPGRSGMLELPMVRALSAKLARREDLVEVILEAGLSDLRRHPDQETSGYIYLARWLNILNRQNEAREMLEMALETSHDTGTVALIKGELGGLDLLNKDPRGLELLEASAGQPSDEPWSFPTRLGWAALYLNRADDAQRYAREALGLRPQGNLERFLNAGPYQLLALAQARAGQIEQALASLDEAMLLERRQTYHDDSPYLLVRARILANAQRYPEAAITLRGIRLSSVAWPDPYELGLRREVALKTGDQEALTTAESLTQAVLDQDSWLPDDPSFSSYLGKAFRSADGQTPPSPLPAAPAQTFATLVENLERLRRREPENSNLKRLSAADLRALMDQAAADEIYVQPVLMQHSVVTLFVTKEQAGLIEVFCDRQKLEQAMLGLTAGLSSPSSSPTTTEADRAYLSQRLVEPWKSRFPDKTRLRWIGEGPLQKLPLSALPDAKGEPLLTSLAVTYLDGPACHNVSLDGDTTTLLIGGASDLAGSARELASVRQLFPKGESWLLGGEIARLKALVPRHRLVHFSSHGAAPTGDQLGARLMGDNHELSAFELSELTFGKDSLAVLGSCQSNVDAGTGHDNTSLVSALRTAGAQVVIGSLWPLDDAMTAELFGEFYKDLRGGAAPDRALASAQLEVRRHQSHPYYWAGLQVVSGP